MATPIGNLGDISYRAVAFLRAADLLIVEDTRHVRRLLQHYGVTTPTTALHDHNESATHAALVERIAAESLAAALLSDAGTPLVSDPGYRLIRAAHAAAIPVHALPGACAAIAALSIAGLATDRFAFEGFLPARRAARLAHLEVLKNETRTQIFYEAPHRIREALADFCTVFELDREIVVARELTKQHESLYRGTLAEVAAQVQRDANAARGEIVILLSGATGSLSDADERRACDIVHILSREMPRASAVKIAAEITGIKRNRLYALVHGDSVD